MCIRDSAGGAVVNIGSRGAFRGEPDHPAYGAAKAALHGFSRSAAFSLGRAGDVLSNVVQPGLTRTDTNAEITDAASAQYSAQAALGRLLDAAEVAGPVVYLASAANTGITGQVIMVSGGT